MSRYIPDEERDNMEEQATYFFRDIGFVEDTDIKNDLYWLHRLLFNPFVCDAERYGLDKKQEIKDSIREFRRKHSDFEIDFSKYGIHEE